MADPRRRHDEQDGDGLEARVAALEAAITQILTAGRGLEADVRELTHDVGALATLAGQTFGEPFRSKAAEIITKRQTD